MPTQVRKERTWRDNVWAIAVILAALDVIFINGFLTKERNIVNIMGYLPNIVWQIILVLVLICALTLIVKYSVFEKKQNALLNRLDPALQAIIYIVFFVTFVDRIALGLVSNYILAATTEQLKELNGNTVATSLYTVIKSKKAWLRGIGNTILLAAIGTIFGFILSIPLVFCKIQVPTERDSRIMQAIKLFGNSFASLYITIIRGTPMMVQSLIIYYGGFNVMAAIMPLKTITEIRGIWTVLLASAITVTLNTAAYISEILRGGIESLDKGQTEAARSLGMTPWQTMIHVVFPQALKNSIPAICNEFIINIKDTSVLNTIGMFELMFATSTIAGTYYKSLEIYYVEAIIYLVLTLGLQALMNWIAGKLDMPQSHGIPSSN